LSDWSIGVPAKGRLDKAIHLRNQSELEIKRREKVKKYKHKALNILLIFVVIAFVVLFSIMMFVSLKCSRGCKSLGYDDYHSYYSRCECVVSPEQCEVLEALEE
jgi:hypothetical protein